ncbi:MAG: hypothetical protein EOP37_10695 [Rubrivivax sp.]|nr:MAG: hypothetical protein EOP37_10695 [Rubrivivax sp.]
MPLSTSIKYLSERGLTVSELSANQFALNLDGDRSSILEEVADGIRFSCWEYVPGPGPNDFHAEFKTLDAALLAVWYFYFGDPVGIGEWRVPMYRHPSWTLEKAAYRIANAISVTAAQFGRIEESRQASSAAISLAGPTPPGGRYEAALRSQFVACESASTPSRRLMMRRDLEEAYVVDDRR